MAISSWNNSKALTPLLRLKAGGEGLEKCDHSNSKTELWMQGLTIHYIKMIVLTMFLGYTVFVYIDFVYKHSRKCGIFLWKWDFHMWSFLTCEPANVGFFSHVKQQMWFSHVNSFHVKREYTIIWMILSCETTNFTCETAIHMWGENMSFSSHV